jgi:4-hydroxyacetophenone monooxygenase
MTVPVPRTPEEIARAVAQGNIPVLLMVLVHLTGDLSWLEPPYTPSRNRGLGDNDSGGLDPELQATVRSAAAAAIERWLQDGTAALPEPDPQLLVRMLAVAMGEEIAGEYGDMIAAELAAAQATEPAFRCPQRPPAGHAAGSAMSAIVVGAGIAGICAGVALRTAGIPFTVLEANAGLGGVWFENTYPGASVDTPSHLYSYSFAQRDWHRYFASQDEILGYLNDVADRFDVRSRIRFGTRVTSARYDESSRTWQVEATDAAGQAQVLSARILISSVGVFNPPKYPEVPGLGEYRGTLVHTARWPAGLDLSGQRVAVLGNGASAMQLVPAIADRVAALTVYQRSPQWVAPFEKFHQEVPPPTRVLLTEVPYYRGWYRLRLGWMFNDRSHPAVTIDPDWPHQDRSANAISEALRGSFTRYIEKQLNGRDDIFSQVVPDYPPYGKRILLDNGWYAALTRENVELVTAPVARFTADGIADASGRTRDFDLIALATGFDASTYLSTFDVTGREGTKLAEFWGSEPQAYLGVTVPRFPNFFALYGPNTQPHGGSVIFTIEAQVRYMTDLICELADNNLDSFECRADVWSDYNEALQAAHEKLIWRHGKMRTYFRNDKGRVVVLSPYRIVDVWAGLREARLDDYVVTAV